MESHKLTMYDVPVTFSIFAHSPQEAIGRTKMLLDDAHFRDLLEGPEWRIRPWHETPMCDHAFVDGYPPPMSSFNPRERPRQTHECDCMGH